MKKLTKLLALMIVGGMVIAISSLAMAQESPSTAPSPAAEAPTAPAADGDKVVFTVGSAYDFVSPNPFKACCTLDYELLSINYDYLFAFGQATLEPESGLGIWPPTVSDDNMTWTVKIREGVKWSDGTPFTAHDVAFTYNFINDNDLAVYLSELGTPASFEAPDDTTLIWHMEKATLAPLAPPWVPILPEHIYAPLDGKPAAIIKEFKNIPAVGTGPFQLVEWKEGQFARFERNPNYWGPMPVIDEVVYRVITNPEALTLALETGEIDFAESIPPALFNRLKTNPDIQTVEASVVGFSNLAFNFGGDRANAPWQDERVRRAISLGIDRQGLVDRALMGFGQVGDSVLLPIYTRYYDSPTEEELQPYDPEAAKKLLDEAGYVDKDGDGVREGPDGPLDFEILTLTSQTYSTPAGKLIAGWLNEIGFNATVKTVSESKAYDIWAQQTFDAYVWGWGGAPDPDFMLSIFTTKQCLVWSDGCYKDPEFDKMWMAQHEELDPEKREALVLEIQKYLYEKNPEIVLFYEKDLQAYRKDTFEGYVPQPVPTGSVLFQFGPYTYHHLRPVGASDTAGDTGSGDSSSSGGGIPPALWVGIAVVILGLIVVVMMRRGKSAEDKE